MTLDGTGGSPAAGERAVDWESVYREHAPRLRRLISRRVPSAAVDDILQDTFVRAYRSRERLDTARPMWPFLATLAYRSSIQWYRAQQNSDPSVGTDTASGDDFPGSDEHLAAYVRTRRVAEALARLTPRHRRILYLHGVGDYGCDAIAATDRLSEKAVRSALDRARANFRSSYRAPAEGPFVAVGLWRSWWPRLRHRVECLRWEVGERLGLLAAGAAVTAVVGVLVVAPQGPPAAYPAAAARTSPPPSTAVDVSRREADGPTPDSVRHVEAARTAPTEPRAVSKHGRIPASDEAPAALALRTGGGLVNKPDSSTMSFEVRLENPVIGGTTTFGTTVYCDRAKVATLECMVLRAVPAPG